MKYLPLLLIVLSVFSCNKTKVSAQSTPGEPVTGKVDRRVKLRQGPEKGADAKSLTLRMGSATAGQGEKVCLPVEASGFTDLIGFQYTMRFDSASLKFEEIRGLNLPGYRVDNFGTRFAERGYVSTLWTDNALQGATLATDHKLYEICFTNLMKSGQNTTVRFQDGPTSFEVIDKTMKELRFVYADGQVKSK